MQQIISFKTPLIDDLPSAAVNESVSGLNPKSPAIAKAVTSSGEATKA